MSKPSVGYKELPGLDGLPFRLPLGADVPMVRESDHPGRQPSVGHEAHARVFDLSKPKDVEEYQAAWQDIVVGKAMCGKEVVQWDESKKNYVVFMRWMSLFLELPAAPKGLTYEEAIANASSAAR